MGATLQPFFFHLPFGLWYGDTICLDLTPQVPSGLRRMTKLLRGRVVMPCYGRDDSYQGLCWGLPGVPDVEGF